MSNRKAPERRSATANGQDQSDLNVAITELHQTIARLNRVIDQVKDEPKAKLSTKEFDVKSTNLNKQQCDSNVLDLDTLVIPRVFH